jgi:hypothetical protein
MSKIALETDWIGLPEAARMLALSWHRAWRLVLTGAIVSRRNGQGRYQVSRASVRRYRASASRRRPQPDRATVALESTQATQRGDQ